MKFLELFETLLADGKIEEVNKIISFMDDYDWMTTMEKALEKNQKICDLLMDKCPDEIFDNHIQIRKVLVYMIKYKYNLSKFLSKINFDKLYYSHTLLFYAIEDRQNDLAKLLINMKVNMTDVDLLSTAVIRQSEDIVKLLLNNGYIVNQKKYYNYTALYYAINYSSIDVIELIIKKVEDINSYDWFLWVSQTHKSIDIKKQIVKILQENGAKIRSENYETYKCLFEMDEKDKRIAELEKIVAEYHKLLAAIKNLELK